jgi:DnaJ-domain-containing protein 1
MTPESLEKLKKIFYFSQIAIGSAVVAWLLFFRNSKSHETGFKVREADLRKGKGPQAPSKDALAHAKIKRNEPLRLTGIQINGPAHEILGVSANASEPEIQKAYREKMKQYHPDKVGRPGSREWNDAQKIAEAINRAKTELLKKKSV